MVSATLSTLEVLVSKSNSSESSLGIGLDNLFKLLLHLIIQRFLLALCVEVVGAGVQHDLGGSLDVESLRVAVFSCLVLIKIKNSGHSLSGRVEQESSHLDWKMVFPNFFVVHSASSDKL